MVGKNNELNKSRHIFEHINRYSIRKLKVGVASQSQLLVVLFYLWVQTRYLQRK